jgi:hypothetical protein
MERGDFARRDVDRNRRLARPDINDQRRTVGVANPRGEKGELLAFGIGRSDDVDALDIPLPLAGRG